MRNDITESIYLSLIRIELKPRAIRYVIYINDASAYWY